MDTADDLRSDPDVPESIRYDPDLAVHEPAAAPAAPPAPSRRRSPLFGLVFGIAALCLGIYVLFGLIASEGRTPSACLADIAAGGGRAWPAAFELSRLSAEPAVRRRHPDLALRVVPLFEAARGADPRLRRYLALALKELGDARALDALVAALGDADPETRLYAAWGLAAIGDRRAAPALLPLLREEDADLRKVAAYALGALEGAADAAPHLRPLLGDPAEDVAWNAALALARMGDGAGAPLLARMLDRAYLDGVTRTDAAGRARPLRPAQKEEAMLNAASALARLGGDAHLEPLRAAADRDPSLRVRQAAREALAILEAAPR